jgi:hypothetical protein
MFKSFSEVASMNPCDDDDGKYPIYGFSRLAHDWLGDGYNVFLGWRCSIEGANVEGY